MIIRITTGCVVLGKVILAGGVVEVSDSDGRLLISCGRAERFSPPSVPQAVQAVEPDGVSFDERDSQQGDLILIKTMDILCVICHKKLFKIERSVMENQIALTSHDLQQRVRPLA